MTYRESRDEQEAFEERDLPELDDADKAAMSDGSLYIKALETINRLRAENLRLRDLLLGWLEDEEDGLDVDHYSRIVSRTREALKDA